MSSGPGPRTQDPRPLLRLDLGAGLQPREGFEGVDLLTGQHRLDLLDGQPWPWKDSEVDELSSSHFIEHIPADELWTEIGWRQDRLFWFFDECYRVLKPGGLFTLEWPSVKHANAFRDPTHRRFLPLEFTYYLSKKARETMKVSHYNAACNFEVETAALLLDKDEKNELAVPTPLDRRPSAARASPLAAHLWDVVLAYRVVLVSKKETGGPPLAVYSRKE